jgi:hypothetical protein
MPNDRALSHRYNLEVQKKYEDASLFICFKVHRNKISDKYIHCTYIYRNFDNFSKGQTKNEMNQVVLFSRRQIYTFYNELVPIPFLKAPFLFLFHHYPFIPHNTKHEFDRLFRNMINIRWSTRILCKPANLNNIVVILFNVYLPNVLIWYCRNTLLGKLNITNLKCMVYSVMKKGK